MPVVPSEESSVFMRFALACFSVASAARIFSCSLRAPAFVCFMLLVALHLLFVSDSYALVGLGAAVPLVASCSSLCFGTCC